MVRCRLVIDETPRSLNVVGQRGGWRVVHSEKKRWQALIEQHLMAKYIARPIPNFLHVSVVMVFPTNHRRDIGNYSAPIEKALGDALVNGGWLLDDTPEFWRFESFRFADERGKNQTIINMEWGLGVSRKADDIGADAE